MFKSFLGIGLLCLLLMFGCNDNDVSIDKDIQQASQKMTLLDNSNARQNVPEMYKKVADYYHTAQTSFEGENYDKAEEHLALFHQLADQAILQSNVIADQKEDAEMEADISTDVVYRVQKGDWLYKISRDQFDDQSVWKNIYQLNKDVISDPNRIYPGQLLTLPTK